MPFTVDRSAVDDVERGAKDSDWQPVKDAARDMAFVEDRVIFDGYEAAGIDGLRARSSNPVVRLPAEPRDYPDAVSRALTELRLAGVDGPYALLLGAEEYRAVSETSDHGYPIAAHLGRMLDGSPIWAPPSAAASSSPPAAATSNCSWARTWRSATRGTTPTASSCTSRRR